MASAEKYAPIESFSDVVDFITEYYPDLDMSYNPTSYADIAKNSSPEIVVKLINGHESLLYGRMLVSPYNCRTGFINDILRVVSFNSYNDECIDLKQRIHTFKQLIEITKGILDSMDSTIHHRELLSNLSTIRMSINHKSEVLRGFENEN